MNLNEKTIEDAIKQLIPANRKNLENIAALLTQQLLHESSLIFGPNFIMSDCDAHTFNDDDEIKFIYIGNRHRHDHNGIVTIANKVVNNEIMYGVSYCSPKDTFSKVIGRNIAKKRMVESNTRIPIREKRHKFIKMQILSDIYSQGYCPSWAVLIIESEMLTLLLETV
jgi:hypothetical protein